MESLESRVLFAVSTVLQDSFEGAFLTGWTNRTASGSNTATKWGLNSTRAAAGAQSAFASATTGGVTAASGYQNNQNNSLVRENLSLANMKVATLSFDYFLNSESGYDTFSVAVSDPQGVRTTLFSESGNYASSGWRRKTLDLGAFAGKSDLDLEFRFQTDASVSQQGGGVWIDELKLTADSVITPGSVSGKLFDDANNNKVQDAGEAPLANWRVYLDQNRNGLRDASEASKLTDANGNYAFTGLAPGTYYVAEELASGFAQTSPGQGGATAGSGFKIDVVFPDNSLSVAQKAAFKDAATRWSQIVVGDVPDVTDGSIVIDDIRITATAPSLDGRGGVLGQAAPTGFRAGSSLPFKGFMEFDSQDLAQLEADGQLTRVILHEMAHVLGFGTIWEAKGLTSGTGGSADPRYLGPGAATQYNSIFGATGTTVPVEGGGSAGTADSHWRESVLANELMTGYLNGGSNPISRVTVGALADLGYAVSYSAADAYSKPASISSLTAAGPASFTAVGPFIKALKDVEFYGEMVEEAVTVSEVNTVPPAAVTGSGSSEPTLLGYAHTVYVDTGVSRTGLDFGNRRTGTSTTPNKPPVVTAISDTPSPVVAGGTISLTAGGVSDPDGTVARVDFYRESNGVAGLQTGAGGDAVVGTDATGADGYKVSVNTAGLAAAVYTYYAQATDNAGAVSAARSCINTVEAPPSSSAPNPGTIAGTVFNDTNGNRLKDTNEPGLSGWRVYVDANKNNALDAGEASVLTGSTGAYSFSGLAAGTHNVRQVDQSGWSRTSGNPLAVTLAAGGSATGRNFANFRHASIAGRVFNDADRDGVHDLGEAALSGVRVYLDQNANARYDAGEPALTTNSAGDYKFTGLAHGTRTVRVVLPTGRVYTLPSSGAHTVTPTSGQAVTGKRFGTRLGTASLVLASADTLAGEDDDVLV